MISLLLADDHAIVRGGLKQIFSLVPDVEVVGEATNGAAVLEYLRRHVPPDLVLLDLNMPGISGVDLLARIRAQHPTVPVLVLSMHNETQMASRILRAGASGYITKDCDPDVLLAAMRKVAAGGHYIAPELAEKMVFDAVFSTQQVPHALLSDRELEVLRLLINGLGVTDIATQLALSHKTVSTYKIRLMEKLNVSNLADLMRYAMQYGLMDT